MSCSADADRGFTIQGTLFGALDDGHSVPFSTVVKKKHLRQEGSGLLGAERVWFTFFVKSRFDIIDV